MTKKLATRHQQQKKASERSTSPSSVQAPTQELLLPLLSFHETAQEYNAYEKLDPRRRRLAQAYLTTEAIQGDLIDLAGVSTSGAVHYLLKTAVQTLFEHLPPEQQAIYKSPKAVLALKTKSPVTHKRISQSMEGKNKGKKRTFTEQWKESLRQGAAKRWQRAREQQAAQEPKNEAYDLSQPIRYPTDGEKPMGEYITVDKNIMSGIPVIRGTQIPIERILFLIKDGYTIEAIHQEYPHVDRKTLEGVIDEITQRVLSAYHGSSFS